MDDHIRPPEPGVNPGKEVPEYPRVFEVNDDLVLKIGYRDSRFIVSYRTGIPLVGTLNLKLEPADIPLVEKVIVRQKAVKALAPAKRKAMKPEEIRLSKRTVVRVGFADDRVEIAATLLITYTIRIKDAEAPKVEEALKFAKGWNARPEVERFLQGAE